MAQQAYTTKNLVSLDSFRAIIWIIISLCTLMCAGRVYVRYKCFHRLLLDDYLMACAWAMLVTVGALGQVYLPDIYMLMEASNGEAISDGANFAADAEHGLQAFGAAIILSYLGIWAIKFNFLLFFKRFGQPGRAYRYFWWAVVAFTLACGIVELAVVQWRCLFGSLVYIIFQCEKPSTVLVTYDIFKVSCILDVATDVLIICFPIVILWKVRIELKKKIILCAIFSLVGVTIGVTVARGSIFGGVYKNLHQDESMYLNVTWVLFWFFIEFSISLIIACLVSYRALFVMRTNKSRDRTPERAEHEKGAPSSGKGVSLAKKAKKFHDSLLESFKSFETAEDEESLPVPESGRFSPTFLTEITGRPESRDAIHGFNFAIPISDGPESKDAIHAIRISPV